MNEDKNTTFDLKETDYDDDDYKGDIKSKDYVEEKAQKVETIQSSSSPSAPSPDSFGKVGAGFQNFLAKLLIFSNALPNFIKAPLILSKTSLIFTRALLISSKSQLISSKATFQQSSAKFQQSSIDFQQSSTYFQAGGSAETQASDWRPGTATLAWAPGNLTPVVP